MASDCATWRALSHSPGPAATRPPAAPAAAPWRSTAPPAKRGITRDYTPFLLILQGMTLQLQGIALPLLILQERSLTWRRPRRPRRMPNETMAHVVAHDLGVRIWGRKWVPKVRNWPSQNGVFDSHGKCTVSGHPISIESTSSFFYG